MNKLRFLFLLAVSVFSVPLFTGCLAVTLVGFAVLTIDEQFMTESDGGSYGEIVYRIDFSHPDDSRMTEQNIAQALHLPETQALEFFDRATVYRSYDHKYYAEQCFKNFLHFVFLLETCVFLM